jgi:Domain of unknown function (DUF4382)
MFRIQSIWPFSVLVFCLALAGCGINTQIGTQPGSTGNSSVVLAMTDVPPSLVSVVSAEVTLTGATLAPGNVSLFSGSAQVDLMRLQTDVAYIATAANIPPGNYTSITLTFANPSLTFENDTASTIAGCPVAKVCTITPSATTLSATVPLTGFTLASSSTAGLLIDVSADNLLNNSLGADFSAGTTVAAFTPAGFGAPPVGAEDVVGQVGNLNAANKTFTLSNASATYSLKADSSSNFFQFPVSGACPAEAFSCLQNNQIVSVDIGIQSDGSILARNVLFEDSDNTDAEIEGTITSTNAASQQFDIVIQTMSAAVPGLSIGQPITVQYFTSPPTPFDLDFLHADSTPLNTASFHFAAPTDLAPSGQQVSIRRNAASTASSIKADRVRLRSSRVTATVGSVGSPNIVLSNLPSSFFGHRGITSILVQTTSALLVENNKLITLSNIPVSGVVSVRGPLFDSGGITQNMVASKVVVK